MKYVICERDRVDALSAQLVAAGVSADTPHVTQAAFEVSQAHEFVGLNPPPGPRVFDLMAPIEAGDDVPRWIAYGRGPRSVGWNYTRDLIMFRVSQ